jgi:SAM-dependent methyltransferase
MPPEEPEALATAAPGLQIDVADAALQAYLQRYPFASGPDEAMNQRGRVAAAAIRLREPASPFAPTLLQPVETLLGSEEESRLQTLFEAVAMAEAAQRRHRDDFGWEASLVPDHARNVLVLGVGDGIELLFLRAVLPAARLTALDYVDALLPGIAAATGVTLITGDMHAHLRALPREYDLVFSNHTLEHMYSPDATLAMLAGLLMPGGHIVSTLPLMGQPGSPFLDRLRAFAERSQGRAGHPHTLHPLDVVFFDLGHPWKTNPADIAATLARAGFGGVRVYQRAGHLGRPLAATADELVRKRNTALRLYRVSLAPLRWAARLLSPFAPQQVPRLLFALERRLPFGVNNTMNRLSEEACFVASVNTTSAPRLSSLSGMDTLP